MHKKKNATSSNETNCVFLTLLDFTWNSWVIFESDIGFTAGDILGGSKAL